MKNKKEEVISLINNAQDILNRVLAIVDVESEGLELNVENPKLDLEKTFQSFFESESNKLPVRQDSLSPNIQKRALSTLSMSMVLLVVVRAI